MQWERRVGNVGERDESHRLRSGPVSQSVSWPVSQPVGQPASQSVSTPWAGFYLLLLFVAFAVAVAVAVSVAAVLGAPLFLRSAGGRHGIRENPRPSQAVGSPTQACQQLPSCRPIPPPHTSRMTHDTSRHPSIWGLRITTCFECRTRRQPLWRPSPSARMFVCHHHAAAARLL